MVPGCAFFAFSFDFATKSDAWSLLLLSLVEGQAPLGRKDL
jgi:hypothetical protein